MKKRTGDLVKKYYIAAIIFIAIFVLGLVLGAFINRSGKVYAYFVSYADNFYFLAMSDLSSRFGLFFIRIINNVGYFLIIFIFGFSIYLFPFSCIIYFYRGLLLSVTVIVFTASYGFSGIVLIIFTIIPQTIITCICLMLLSLFGVEFSIVRYRHKCNSLIKGYAIIGVVLLVLSFVGAIIELLFLTLLIRPLNQYF